MAPPQQPFKPAQLQEKVQIGVDGKRRKETVDLRKCALQQMLQYDCKVEYEQDDESGTVVCRPVARLFRLCRGGLTVETTAWEEKQAKR